MRSPKVRIAYDLIGSSDKMVAVIGANYPKADKKIAKEIMKRHKGVKSVLKKLAERKGTYRLYPMKLIEGDKNTEVIHKEYGYLLKVDPRKAYFSPRESTERQRIAEMVKSGERILVMFCGVAPYPIAIAKKKDVKITGIDINLDAIRYAHKNVHLNKVRNIKLICGDVRYVRRIGKFDRIIMPLAENAIDYLDVAFNHSKKGTIIHVYGLSNKKDFSDFKEKIENIANTYNIKYKIIKKEKVLPYAPRVLKVRFDLKILH